MAYIIDTEEDTIIKVEESVEEIYIHVGKVYDLDDEDEIGEALANLGWTLIFDDSKVETKQLKDILHT